MYIRIKEGKAESYSISQLKADNPNTSFPKVMSDALLAEYGVYPAKKLAIPSYDERTHTIKETEPYSENGEWLIGHTLEKLPLDIASTNMRAERKARLAETDWVVARAYEEGNPVPEEWQSYRQNLRDLPQQQGFPYDIVWPNKPE